MPDGFRILDRGTVAELLLYEPIEPGSAKAVIDQLTAIGNKAISLRINSPGGDVFDGISIYNALKRHPARVTAHIDGLAASIASVIAMAAGEVRIARNGFVMVHDPSAFAVGTAADLDKMSDTLRGVKVAIAASYSRSGQPEATIAAWMAEETWFTAEEAVAAGLADVIDEPVKLAACFDLSHFRNLPPLAARMGRGPAARLLGRNYRMDDLQRPDDSTPATDDIQAIVNDPAGAIAERKRVQAIHAACRALNMGDLADAYIDRGIGIEAARADLMNRYAELAQAATAGRPSISFGIDHNDPTNIRNRMVSALASRLAGTAAPEEAREFRSHRLVDMLRHLAAVRG